MCIRDRTYTTQNGVRYPDLMLEEPEAAPGKYGLLRLRYLEKSDPGQLNSLLLEGALNSHLAQIDRQVRGQVEQTLERLVQRTRLPDKQTDPLGSVSYTHLHNGEAITACANPVRRRPIIPAPSWSTAAVCCWGWMPR